MPAPSEPDETEPVEPREIDPEHEAGGVFAPDAPADALARARAAAKARGLETGPARRRAPRRKRVEQAFTASGKDGRDPVLLGDQMSNLLARAGWEGHVRSAEVVHRWAPIVGQGIAQHTTALRHEATVLTVQAHSTAWATQLRLLEPTIIGRLAEVLGEGVVTQLDVKGPHAPSWSRGKFRVPGRGPRDTYG